MAWANQKVFAAVQILPDESLESFIVIEDWNAKHLLEHLVSAAEWYVFCLRGGSLREFSRPSRMSDVADLMKSLQAIDSELLSLGELDEEMLKIEFQGQIEWNLRSTMISQAIYHATEHRSQLVGALEIRGFNPIILDDIDLWAFENFEAEVAKNS